MSIARSIRFAAFVLLGLLLVASGSHGEAETGDRTQRATELQQGLEHTEFRFNEGEAGLVYSLSQFRANCQIRMTYDPAKWWMLTFEFVRSGKTVVSIEGHAHSVFRADGDVLYFARFSTSSDGCVVAAYDLAGGGQLWSTPVQGVGPVQHSAYRNEVTMAIAGDNQSGTVSIKGQESYGDYTDILDRKTGALLAHKIYREGFHR